MMSEREAAEARRSWSVQPPSRREGEVEAVRVEAQPAGLQNAASGQLQENDAQGEERNVRFYRRVKPTIPLWISSTINTNIADQVPLFYYLNQAPLHKITKTLQLRDRGFRRNLVLCQLRVIQSIERSTRWLCKHGREGDRPAAPLGGSMNARVGWG